MFVCSGGMLARFCWLLPAARHSIALGALREAYRATRNPVKLKAPS